MSEDSCRRSPATWGRWYKDAIVYGIDVECFQDSNGDGIGDLGGLIQRLDYIESLGVNCVWLMPMYRSPNRDNGYDVADYYALDPNQGTLGELVEFIARAGERGIRVILDVVLNHTSDEHPWFEKARRDPQSAEHGYYIWADEPAPAIPEKGSMFPGEEEGVWAKDDISGRWYYHRFYSFQPELDLTNPQLQREIHRILGFWLRCGATGFRIDAASHMIEPKGPPGAVHEAGHELLREIRRFVEQIDPGAMLVGEADEEPAEIAAFFGEGDELHALLNFLMTNYLFLALAREEAEPIEFVLKLLPEVSHESHWVNFLRNLDELDLERLSETQRQDVFDRFAPDPGMRIYGRGIRRRFAPMLKGDAARLKLAYSLLFAMPGSPAFVYGDEIGMGDDLSLAGRTAVRTPMQWTAGRAAGFTSGRPFREPISGSKFTYRSVNVAAQDLDPSSLLNWIRGLVRLRRLRREIGDAKPVVSECGDPAVVALGYRSARQSLLTLHNLSGREVEVGVNPVSSDVEQGRILHSSADDLGDVVEAGGRLGLEPFASRWLAFDGPLVE